MFTLTESFKHCTNGLSQCDKKTKSEIKGLGKKENKVILFV